MPMLKEFTRKILVVAVAGFALTIWLSTADAAGRDIEGIDGDIAGPPAADAGVWRTRAQTLFDPVDRTLTRRLYTVWDSRPERDVDFVWIPRSVRDDTEGKINGIGRLIWRLQASRPTIAVRSSPNTAARCEMAAPRVAAATWTLPGSTTTASGRTG
jgi:hypothetical protein